VVIEAQNSRAAAVRGVMGSGVHVDQVDSISALAQGGLGR